MDFPSVPLLVNGGSMTVYRRAMQFRILGPLEVENGDGPIPLGGRKQRAVLAHLLIRANEVVPASTLIDELWGEEPPETARNTLQTYVSHLRKLLGPDRVVGHPPGYRLEVDPAELDAPRFEALLRKASTARAIDPRLAGAVFDEALELWRGPALADVRDDSSLVFEATRWDELRLVAEQERIEALLDGGEHARAAGELESLLARHRLRETFWAQLMLALYRSGRQGEALAAFARAREVLADELGIDPSPELARLHAQILQQDPTLTLRGEPLRGYRLLERIGDGPNGSVFRGIQPHVERDVAIKVIRDTVADDPEFIRRFEPEAQAVAALEHPHVVPVYDYWREPDAAYVVTRFLPGGSLAGLEARGEAIAPERAARIVEQLEAALDFAHRSGVTHGAVGPSNVLFDLDGNAYLGDFRIGAAAAATTEDDGRALAAIAARLLPHAPPAAPSDAEDARAGVAPRNPYKGLRPFGEADTRDFFGRARIVERVAERFASTGFLALVGPSGSGKSSIARAGVVPVLRDAGWFVADLVPGVRPLDELEAALVRIADRPCPQLGALLAESARGLVDAADLVAPGDAPILLVVDQFEELFTLTSDEGERAHVLELVRVASIDPRSRVRVLVTLRADFYDRPLSYPRFGQLLGAGTEVVPPLTPDELEAAITSPARGVGVSLEPGLTAELIADVAHHVGALPLLQFALTELFERRRDGVLTLDAYREIGGVVGALSARAERLYRAADERGRSAAHQVFLRLVTLGEGRGDTRRRVTRSELARLDVEPAAVDAVIDAFGRHRILTFDREPSTREPTVEIAHEALLVAWSRLRGWIDDAREDLRLAARLERAAAEWQASGREASLLLRGAQLERFSGWRARTTLAIGESEAEFLAASVASGRQAEADEAARRDATRRLERRALVRLRWLVAVLALAALVGSTSTLIAVRQRSAAVDAEGLASIRELAAASAANLDLDPQLSLLLAVRAAELSPSGAVPVEVAQALHDAVAADREVLTLHDPSSVNVSYSPDGALLATGGSIGGRSVDTVVLWDARTGEKLRTLSGHHEDVSWVAFSPDGTRLASTAPDGTIVWDTATGRPVLELFGPAYASAGATFTADGMDLVLGVTGEGARRSAARVRVLSVATGRDVRPPLASPVDLWQAPVANADGSLIAAPGNGGTPVWDARTGDLLRLLPVASTTVAFSPDGRRLATASDPARVWDATTGRAVLRLATPPGQIGIDWSRDGSRIATSGVDGTTRVWDASTGEAELELKGNAGLVANIAFSPDGSRLLVGAGDATARVFAVGPTDTAEVWGRSFRSAGLASFSPDGRTVHAWLWGSPGGVRTLDGNDGTLARVHRNAWMTTLYDWDGTRLTSRGWSIVDEEAPRSAVFLDISGDGSWVALGRIGREEPLRSYRWPSGDDQLQEVAVTPDGRSIVGLRGSGAVTVWDVASGKVRATYAWKTGRANAFALSPDGRSLAIAGSDGTVIRDLSTGTLVKTLAGTGEGTAVAFNQDGSLLATGSTTGTSLWDVATGEHLLRFAGGPSPVRSLSFDPAGTHLLIGSEDGLLRVVTLSLDELLTIARSRIARAFTAAECRQYLHVTVCPVRAPE
jgi:WD40 repeat protein/DNA-binding SARP family transcriptional activator